MLRPRPPGTTADLDATIVRLNQSLVDSLNNQRRFKQQVHSDLNAILGRLAVCADAVARVSGPSAAPAIIDLNNQIDQLDTAIAGIDGHQLSQRDVDEAIAPAIAQEGNIRFDTEANRRAFRTAPPVYNSVDGARPYAFGTRRDGSARSDGSAGSDGTGTSRGWLSGFPSLFGTSSRSARSEDGSTELRNIARPASAGISSDRPDFPSLSASNTSRPASNTSRPANYAAPLDPRLDNDPFGIGHTTDSAWRLPLNSRRPSTGGRTRKRRR